MGLFTLIFEMAGFLLFTFSIVYLGLNKKDYRAVAQILIGSLFGISLEFMNVLLYEVYTYSTQFLIQAGTAPDNVPISAGLYWGLILYSCMQVSDRIGLPEWSRPSLDGILALTIDMSLDTIAIRVDGGFWNWLTVPFESLPTSNGFFGVTYGNFTGWLIVVFTFSALLRAEKNILDAEYHVSRKVTFFYYLSLPIVALIPLFVGSLLTPPPLNFLTDTPILSTPDTLPTQAVMMLNLSYFLAIAIGVQVIALIKARPKFEKDVALVPLIVFMYFHIAFLSFYLFSGAFLEAPLILFIALPLFAFDVLIHWSILDRSKLKQYFQAKISPSPM